MLLTGYFTSQEKRKAKKALKKAKKEAKRAKVEPGSAPAAEQPGASSSGSERSGSSDSEAGGTAAEEPRARGRADTDREAHRGSLEQGRPKRQRHDTPSPDGRDVRHERSGRDGYREGASGRERERSRERRRSRSPAGRRR